MSITNGYVTQTELKGYLGIDVSDTTDDERIDTAAEAASRLIDDYCGRFFYDEGSATARTFTAMDRHRLRVGDFSTTTGLVVETDSNGDGTFDTTWASDDFQVEPLNPIDGHPFHTIVVVDALTFPVDVRRARTRVTAQWGWAVVPERVKHACAIQAGTIFKRATEGAAPVVTIDGTTLQSSKFLDHQATLLLDPLRVAAGVAIA